MSNIKVFEDKKIRTEWNEQEEDWYFSVVDIVGILTDKDYDNARKYWKVLKGRLKNEGSELVSFCYQLKLPAQDGKLRETDVLNTKGILRLVQSIPSKKAEPFKMWLAQVGSERLDEIADPQKSIDRAIATYRDKGYSEEWITQRMMTIKMRKELTAEWQETKKLNEFMKEYMANAYIKLLENKEANEITIDEITKTANVGRATYFRYFSTKMKCYYSNLKFHGSVGQINII